MAQNDHGIVAIGHKSTVGIYEEDNGPEGPDGEVELAFKRFRRMTEEERAERVGQFPI